MQLIFTNPLFTASYAITKIYKIQMYHTSFILVSEYQQKM